MRIIYTTLFYLLIPFILLRLFWRGFKAPEYRRRWRERFGWYKKKHAQKVIWFHAVSLGEAESVFPLVKICRQRLPQYRILITTTTPTGSSRVKSVMGDDVEHVYLPYDIPRAVCRFMLHFRPVTAIIMETEIWPNLFAQCANNAIPLLIINARLSEKSAKGYRKMPGLTIPALTNVKTIATQTAEDARRFIAIGADPAKVMIAGNIKFDSDIADDILTRGKILRNEVFPQRLVWIAASTHKGEDELFVQAYRQLKKQFADLLLMIVPRHPERFNEVKNLCIKAQLHVVMRSENKPCGFDTDIYVADTMGELKMLYAASDIAFVAGSLLPVGGHNVLEPAALGIPVLFGPHMFNFKQISRDLLVAGAAIQCRDNEALMREMLRLLGDRQSRLRLAEKGKEFVNANKGALETVFSLVYKNVA